MDIEIFFESTYAQCSYIPEYKAVIVVWNGKQTNQEYKKTILECLEFQKNSKTQIVNYISDIRKQSIVDPEARKWFENVALPKAVSQGLKRAAVISDSSAFRKYHFDMIYQVVGIYKLPMKHFDNPEDAFKWFCSFD
ncbi:MAG TPA: STAS/SEC14 domain-containing protein [Tenuifilaceae bacterium]|nr:STAS/SEC14 domain-containing protein [Tenuifilaceae bacterium]HPN20943.1 STAS/SEC14 domain-containing protein [Tenuifilaceae bacterium]HPV55795.1 STAS/SEC14 domain-containing protein [Tenuifilaceae bacterium]